MSRGETCERCGMRYGDLDTGLTFAEVQQMLWSPDPDPSTWRHKGRHTVLGMWHQLKGELWIEHLATCDGWAPGNLKAYRIEWYGTVAYISAPRRARAQYICAQAIAETFQTTIGFAFKTLRCKRAAWGDKHASFCGEGVIPTYSKIYTDAKKRENVAPYAVPAFILYVGPGSDEIEIVRNPFCVNGEKDQ